MEHKYEIKEHCFGPESGMKNEIQFLNRTLRWTKQGITCEADQRHADIVIKMNMKQANAVSTPTVPESSEEANLRLSSPDMTKDEASRFRGLLARVNYLSLDRLDLQFAAKTASQHMVQPKACDWAKIKRIARYLVKASRAVQKFVWQEKPTQIKTYVDSDWAGNKITRKSTSGGAMFLGGHLVESWSSAQQVVALSSGEAGLHGILDGATQAKGLISMMADFGEKVVAAIGIAHRRGLGKTRHIEVQHLWVQHGVKEGKLTVKKVGTNNNPTS